MPQEDFQSFKLRRITFIYYISKKYLENLNKELFILETDLKAMIVERFNRTQKEKIWHMFTESGTKNYTKDW